ncbi:MAG: hypothetical protein ACXWWQ_03175 [Candidatus Limnocylindria bacterium]
MDEPVPIRRAVIGCLTIALLVAGLLLLIRPALFTFAPPRDDGAVVVGAVSELGEAPMRRDVILARSHGWSGEVDAGDGRVQHTLLISPSALGAVAAVNAASPGREECPVEVAGDRLEDCDGRTWTFDGAPIDAADPPLERFPVIDEGGTLVVDMTRLVDD